MNPNEIKVAADENLLADLNRAATPDEVRQLLHNAMERSAQNLGLQWDPERNTFVPALPKE